MPLDDPARRLDEDGFRALEELRIRLLAAGDPAAARLHAPDFQLVTPTGRCLSREEYLSAIERRELIYRSWVPGPIAVRLFGEAALLRYRARLVMGPSASDSTAFDCWHIDAYEWRTDGWQVVWSQATAVK